MRSIFLVLFLLLAPLSGALSQQEPDLATLQQKAEAGDAWAQLNLGAAYDHALGVERDVDQAIYWYKLAAEQGLAEAQFNLAHILVDEDISAVAAAEWMQKAAEQGLADAQYLLGIIYTEGIGVPVNHAKAKLWLQRASEQGQADAALFMKEHYAATGGN